MRREGRCVRKSNLEKRSQGGAHIEKNAALKLDEKRELAFLEKPFDGFYVTFADQNIDKEKIYQTFKSQDLIGRDGPNIIVVCDNLLGPKTN